MSQRLVILDTETTGRAVNDGHRLLEIGCVELIDRRRTGRSFHRRVNPGRAIDPEAIGVHGIRNADVVGAPEFRQIMNEFTAFVRDSTLVIHNAPFDLAFLNMELALAGCSIQMQDRCRIIDTLGLARSLHPGRRNNLDALCDRYGIDSAARADGHGALIDANILADVYLAMTSGQSMIEFGEQAHRSSISNAFLSLMQQSANQSLPVIQADIEETQKHEVKMRDLHGKHLSKLSKIAAALRNDVKMLTEQLEVLERKIEASGSESTDAQPDWATSQKLREALCCKRIESDKAETELLRTREEGPRLLRMTVTPDPGSKRS